MMKSTFLIGSMLAGALFAGAGMLSPAMAQHTNTPGIDRSQDEIGARIEQGLAAGRITPSEARILYQRQREIQFRENRFKADGFANPQERQQLRQDLDSLRAEVDRAMTNPRVAPRQVVGAPGIDQREMRIRDQIEEGVRSGSISERQARRLSRRERQIERDEARAKADGVFTRQERRQIRDQLAALRDEVDSMMREGRMMRDDRRESYVR
jgi:hypothetical protein